jgi:hypothetical protein
MQQSLLFLKNTKDVLSFIKKEGRYKIKLQAQGNSVLGYQANSYNVALTPQEDTAASPKHRRTKTTHRGEKRN